MQNSNSKKLNVLFLCSWYPNRDNPTLGNFVQKHAEAANRENNITILSVISSPNVKSTEIKSTESNGLKEIRVYYHRSNSKLKIWGKILNFRNNYIAFKKGYQLAVNTSGKFDLLHLNVTYPLGVWAKRIKRKEGVPFVITEHSNGFHIDSDHAYSSSILNMSSSVFNEASYIFPVSEDLKNQLKRLAPNANYKIISNAVDESCFSIDENKNNSTPKLVHISTAHDPQKNITGIINIIEKIATNRPDFELHIISDGDTSYAKKIIEQKGLKKQVVFHETMTTIEVATFLRGCDALVLFSNYENFPCVIPESYMSGIPVISTRINGIPEHVYEWSGILVEKGNESELETAICRILDKKMNIDSHKLRSYALEHFSYEAIGKSFDRVYRQVLKA